MALVLISDPTRPAVCVLEEYTKYFELGIENPMEPAARDILICLKQLSFERGANHISSSVIEPGFMT